MKIVKLTGAWFLALLSPVLMWSAVRHGLFLPGAGAVLALYLSVLLLPWARRHENLWIFLLGGLTLLPLNIRLTELFFEIFPEPVLLLRVIRGLLVGMVMFCTEETILAAAARFFWKKQQSIVLDE